MTAGDRPDGTLPIYEVHAEGHFRRRRYALKMLLSGHLVGKEFSLTDQKRSPARFFLFGEGKILWKIGRFCPQFYPRTTQGQPPPAVQPSAARHRRHFEHRGRDVEKRTSSQSYASQWNAAPSISTIKRMAVCAVRPLESRSGLTSMMSRPTSFPLAGMPIMRSSISAKLSPPGSSVPVPGASVGSMESTSKVT